MKTFRGASVALLLTGAALAAAQFDPTVLGGVGTLRERNIIKDGLPENPFQPKGFPNPEAKRPDEEIDSQRFEFIHADETYQRGADVQMKGNVEFLARGYRVRCDQVTGNTITQVFTAEGHVYITGNGANVYGEKVTIDFASETYVAERAETQLDPYLIENRLNDKLYVSGKLSSGTRLLTHTQDGLVTTCNLEHPHYDLTARDLEVRTGKRAIFRDAKLVILDRTILQIPYLVIPLDDRTQRYTPEVGYSDQEGYFIKNIYAVPMKGRDVLTTHEDYMTKLGLGLGADYGYEAANVAGTVRAYKIFGPGKTFTFSDSHRQAFRGGSFTLDNDYQADNYLTAPGQTLLNSRAGVTFDNLWSPRATTRLTYTRNSSNAQGYSSVSETIGIGDTRSFGKARTDTQLTYLDSQNKASGGSDTDTQRLQVKFTGTDDLGPATAALQYQRTVPIGETQGYLGSSDLTPELSLQSDTGKLFGKDVGRDVPIKSELSWGEYADPRKNSQVDRTAFSLAYNKSTPSQQRLTLDTAANFRQGFYSDDTAQYILGLNENVRYKLGNDNTGINFRYSYLRPYGYSPLTIDNTGRNNVATTDINVRPVHPLLLGLQTGYDLERLRMHEIAWQQLGLRSEYSFNRTTLLRGLYTYDTFREAWSQVRFDFSSIGTDSRVNLNAQYDGVNHTWSTLNGSFDGLRWGRAKFAALFAYNGYTKEFETKQYAVTYDLHCAEAVLAVQENNYGFRPGRQIFLLIRLKALPFDLPFGTGTRGQGVGVGSGANF